MTAVQPAAPSAPSVPPKMMTSLRVGDDSIEVINQLLLPHEIQWDSCDSVEDAYDAIKSMRVSCTGPLLRLSTRLIRHSLPDSRRSGHRIPRRSYRVPPALETTQIVGTLHSIQHCLGISTRTPLNLEHPS